MARLQLSTADIATALRGLSDVDRAELLALLQDAEREAARAPVDEREPIDVIIKRMHCEAAEASGDPDAWWAAHHAHEARREFHYERLMAGRPKSGSIQDFLADLDAAFSDAHGLAERDGFPTPLHDADPQRRTQSRY